jgi:hypothetical protein
MDLTFGSNASRLYRVLAAAMMGFSRGSSARSGNCVLRSSTLLIAASSLCVGGCLSWSFCTICEHQTATESRSCKAQRMLQLLLCCVQGETVVRNYIAMPGCDTTVQEF